MYARHVQFSKSVNRSQIVNVLDRLENIYLLLFAVGLVQRL